jgi:hypothetical protein
MYVDLRILICEAVANLSVFGGVVCKLTCEH